MTASQKKEFEKDTECFRILMGKKLNLFGGYEVDAINCLIKENNYKSAYMNWLHFEKYFNIELDEEEQKIVSDWYYWFGR